MRRLLLYGFISLDIVLLLLFIGGYLARYISPRQVWFLQLLAIMLPLTSIALLGFGIVTVLIGKWKLCCMHVALLLLAVIDFFPLPSLRPISNNRSDILKIMSFNAKALNADAYASMKQLLQQEHPDVIALQEVSVQFEAHSPRLSAPRHILPLLKDYKFPRPNADGLDFPYRLHLPVFAKIDYVGQDPLSIRPETSSTRQSTVTRSYFQWQGQKVALYNIHLRSFNAEKSPPQNVPLHFLPKFWWHQLLGYRKDFLVRVEEAIEIRSILNEETLPFLVCGDLNSTPQNWIYRYIASGLKDTFKVAGKGSGMTYHSAFPIVRIDYILASHHWEIVTAYTSSSGFSDHRPLVTQLYLVDK